MDQIKKYSKLLLFSIMAFFPWIDYAFRKYKIPFSSIWDDILIIFAVLLGILLGRKRLYSTIQKPTVIFGFLFASIAFVSFFLNDYLFLAFQHQFRLLFEPFLIYLSIYMIEINKDELNIYIKLLIFSAVFLSLHGVYQYLAKVPTPAMWVDKELESTSIYTRAFSVVGSPNVLAAYLELALPLPFIYFFKEKSFLKKALSFIAFACIVLGLMLTFSRGGWFGAFGSLFVSFSLFNPIIGIVLISLSGILIYIVPTLRVRILSLIDPSYIEKSMESGGRLFRWRYGVLNGMEHPIVGTGLGTFGSSAAQKYGYFSYTSMDSVYINIFAETGLLGLISFTLWVVSSVGDIITKFFKKKDFLYLFIAASIISILIHIFVENLFNVWGITINFWALNALGEREYE